MSSQQQQQQQQQTTTQQGLLKDGRFFVDKKIDFLFRVVLSQANAKSQPQPSGSQSHADPAAALEDFENYCDQVHLFCAGLKQAMAIQEATANATSEQPLPGSSLQSEEAKVMEELEKALSDLCEQSKEQQQPR